MLRIKLRSLHDILFDDHTYQRINVGQLVDEGRRLPYFTNLVEKRLKESKLETDTQFLKDFEDLCSYRTQGFDFDRKLIGGKFVETTKA